MSDLPPAFETETDIRLRSAIRQIVRRLTDDHDVLAIFGSWGDTLEDGEIAELMEDWLSTGKILHERH